MKSLRSFSLAIGLVAAFAFTAAVSAHEGHNHEEMAKAPAGQLVPITEKDAGWAAKAKSEYPTEMCVVSGDKLGADMGKPVDYVWREEGKPDRLITFCCKDCVKDFNKDPQKYLKQLDAAGVKNGDAHTEHKH